MPITKSVTRISHPLVVLIAAAMLLAGQVDAVYAQDGGGGEQESSDVKKAEAYYKKGVTAFFNKKYSLAITYFQRANALDPDPVVLYNISLAQSRLGNAQEALDAALEAKRMGGLPADTAQKNEFRIVAYRRALNARGIAEALRPKAQVEPTEPASADEDGGMSAIGWAGVGTAGVGAAALIGAGVLNFVVQGNLDEYDTARADGDYGRATGLKNDIADRQSMGRVMLYSGAGLLAVGGALWAYDFFGGQDTDTGAARAERASVFGAVGADGASVQLRWDF